MVLNKTRSYHAAMTEIWEYGRKKMELLLNKYDLSSFTSDPITSMRLGKDQNMLFLGSKDMNVYLIDVGRGKLCVVYEGHWNKVNLIYTIPERDILITVSESNIKVWDLEYDECIKNMNDHESNIVHVSQYEEKSQQHILTIGANFEMRMWNYETGEDSKDHQLNIDKEGKMKSVICACTYGQQLFLATNKCIVLYSLIDNMIVLEFKAYNNEQVIDIFSYKTKDFQYLVVTTRTSCILYRVLLKVESPRVEKICGYYINAKRKLSRSKQTSKYNNNFRFYFTSAKISELRSVSKTEVKKLVAGTTFTGLLDNTEGVSFENHEVSEIHQKSKAESAHDERVLTTRVIDTAREKIRQEVLLVCLGDSKGYLHFNHLYIE